MDIFIHARKKYVWQHEWNKLRVGQLSHPCTQPGPCCAGLVQRLCSQSLRPKELGGCLALYHPHSPLPAENAAVPLAAFHGVPGERRGQKAHHMASQGNFGLNCWTTKRGRPLKFSSSCNLPTRRETKVEPEAGPGPGEGRARGRLH